MTTTFDTIFKGATVVNHDGSAIRDIGVKTDALPRSAPCLTSLPVRLSTALVCIFFRALLTVRCISVSRVWNIKKICKPDHSQLSLVA